MNRNLVQGALAALLALSIIAPAQAGRGGGIAAGVFGGMLAGSMIANAANNRNYSGGTTYYVESPAPMSSEYYNGRPTYNYNNQYAAQTPYYNDYGSPQNGSEPYEQELAALAQQNSDLRARVKQAQKNYADLKNQYDEILAAGREYKRKFLALERKNASLEKQYYDLQLRCDALQDSAPATMTNKAPEPAPVEIPTTPPALKEIHDATVTPTASAPIVPVVQ